jgi:hypothetical protein
MICTPKILRPCIIACIAGSISPSALGQTVLTAPASIPTATGRTIITPVADITIPAALDTTRHPHIATWTTPSRLGIPELSTVHAQVCMLRDTWTAGVLANALSTDRYTELGLSATGAVWLTQSLSAGLSCTYVSARARGFAAEHLAIVNAQMLFLLDSSTAIGAVAINVGQTSRAGSQSGAASQFRLGVSRTLTGGVQLDADVVLPLRLATGVALALRWDVLEFLRLRLAYSTVPQSAEASIALDGPGGIVVFATVHYHLSLGASPTIGIGYRW